QIVHVHERQRELEERFSVCQTEVASAVEEIAKIQASLVDLSERLVETADDLHAAVQTQAEQSASCERLRALSREREEQLNRIREDHVRLQDEKTKLEVNSAQKKSNQEHLEATVHDRYTLTMSEVLPQYQDTIIEVTSGEARRQELRE